MPRYVITGVRYGPEPEQPQLTIESTTLDRRLVVRAHGEIDLATAPALERAIQTAITEAVDSVTIDLAGVRFLDSTGLQVLVRGRQRAAAQGAAYVVVNLQPIPRQVMEITGLLKLLTSDS